jgi:hypothetical protein
MCRRHSCAIFRELTVPDQICYTNVMDALRTARCNIQKFYMVLVLCCVFCVDLRTDSGFGLYSIELLVFITVVESVYSAVRTDCLYKADL